MGPQFFCILQIRLQHGFVFQGFCPIDFGEQGILGIQVPFQLGSQYIPVQQVAHPDPGPGHFIHIAGADAAFGGTDLGVAQGSFLQFILFFVVREYHMGPVADQQIAGIHALGLHFGDFLQHHTGVDHDPIAQDAGLVAVQDAAGQQPQFIGYIVDHHRVAGVGAAGITDHCIGLLGQIVHDLAFAFVPPLGTDYYNR